MTARACEYCGADIRGYPGRARHCSADCKTRANPRPCEHCGADIRGYPARSRYCSPRCSALANPRACEHCAADISYLPARRRFCSKSCSARAQDGWARARGTTARACEHCGAAFTGRSTTRYCSQLCGQRARADARARTVACEHCGAAFTSRGRIPARFCSMACALWRPPEPCSIPTCDNPARKVGYCQGHYSRLLAGDLRPDEPLRPRGKSGGPCAREGCPRSARVRGLCRTHYTLRWRETNAATCTVDTCDTSPVVAQGLCEMHYGRLRRPGAPRLDAPARPYNWGGTTCTVEGCPQRAVALGWCGMHRKRVMVNGVPGDAAPIIVVDRIRERLRRKPLRRPRAGHHTVDEWQAKLDEYDGLCFYCDRPATTRDHWIPVSKGGPDTIDNIVPACTSCNSRKRDKLPAVFLAELEDLDDG